MRRMGHPLHLKMRCLRLHRPVVLPKIIPGLRVVQNRIGTFFDNLHIGVVLTDWQ